MSVMILGYGIIVKRGTDKKEKEEIKTKGIKIYNYLRPILEPAHNGKWILIDVETKEYLIGKETREMELLGEQRFLPHGIFHCRIGEGSEYFGKE